MLHRAAKFINRNSADQPAPRSSTAPPRTKISPFVGWLTFTALLYVASWVPVLVASMWLIHFHVIPSSPTIEIVDAVYEPVDRLLVSDQLRRGFFAQLDRLLP